MPKSNALLRKIPKVDEVLASPALQTAAAQYGHEPVAAAARGCLAALREAILKEETDAVLTSEQAALDVLLLLKQQARPALRRVVNATGVILHTNLGRAPMAPEAVGAAVDAARGYCNLEYDIDAAQRGSRHSLAAPLLCELTGAEAAMVVNNNAAAVLLALSALCKGREVVVSRGELVEIGGSFRVPEIMALSGAVLREVGATNRTHPADYENAVNETTAAFFKAHTSNFKITGFTSEVSIEEMVGIARAHGLPVLYDLGSGRLLPWHAAALPGEPGATEALAAGADLVCFSGDKLLGGPQAGILLGRAALIEALKKHPLARALRVDKMTLAALEATLRLYRSEEVARREVPALRMLETPLPALREKAACLASMLGFLAPDVAVVDADGELGAGSAPALALPSAAVAVSREPVLLEAALRGGETPVIARIARDRLLLDVRTIDEEDFPLIAARLKAAVEGHNG